MKIVTQIGLLGDAGFEPAFVIIQASWIVSNVNHMWVIVDTRESCATTKRPKPEIQLIANLL